MRVVSAHRTPDAMVRYAKAAAGRGLRVIICRRGRRSAFDRHGRKPDAAAVFGVPVESKSLKRLSSLLSILQMPGGVPVATVAIGGGQNTGLLAAQILGAGDAALRARVSQFKRKLAA